VRQVHLWEAIIQFVLYILYVMVMLYSERLEMVVKSWLNPGVRRERVPQWPEIL
jgi:hypothetical protein